MKSTLKMTISLLSLLLFTAQIGYGASINVIWDSNEEADLSGYKIYYRTSSGNYGSPIDVGKVTSFELSGLIEGITYYMALTAYDTSSNESEKTDEVWGIAEASSTASTTTILPDTTPPSGTISINNGDKLTHSPNVTLTLFATDDGEELGGDALMTFSNDNQEWSDPEPYTVIKMWTLTPDKGDKTVYVKFRDAAGNWMTEPAKDQIRFEESEEICDDPYKLQPAYVAASSEFLPFREKDKAVDGNYLTFWSTPPSLYRKNEFITLDLGEIKQMSRIDMYALRSLTMDFFPVNFQVQLSSDNINWEEIRSEKNYTLKSTHFDSWELNSLEARYLRVSITKAKTFFIFYVAQIAEIEVYGCDIPEQNFAPLDDTASIKDAEPGDTLPEEGGEAAELDQAPPSVPGRPVITFN